jgi:serine protease Do
MAGTEKGTMKKILQCGTLVLVAALASPAAGQVTAAAQRDFLLLRAPGSSIGIEIMELDESDRKQFADGGVRVVTVASGTPAGRAGFQSGDIVIEFDGEKVKGTRQFRRVVEETPPGREVNAVVMRAGERRTLRVTPELALADRAVPDALRRVTPGNLRTQPWVITPSQPFADRLVPGAGRIGLSVMPLESQLADYFGAKQGVLVASVTADSAASRAGLKAGDVIVEIGSRQVSDSSDITNAVRSAKPGSELDVHVLRDRKDVHLKVTVPPGTTFRFEREVVF